MRAREQRADYQVSKAPTLDQPTESLTTLQVIDAIERGLHTGSGVIDQNLVNRKARFFQGILLEESTRKAFLLLVP